MNVIHCLLKCSVIINFFTETCFVQNSKACRVSERFFFCFTVDSIFDQTIVQAKFYAHAGLYVAWYSSKGQILTHIIDYHFKDF